MKKLTYTSIILCLITTTFSFNSSYASNQNTTESFEELVSNPAEYDKKEIVVEGTIDNLKFTTAEGGEPYTLFKIIDNSENILHVYYQGKHLNVKKGSVVKVVGEFLKQKRYSFYRFKNVVNAKDVIVET